MHELIWRLIMVLTALAALLPFAVPVWAQAPAAQRPDAAREQALIHMVRQDCGSCHGLTLKGGLGPALTPQALHDRPAESLVATIVGGRPGTPMPPFRGLVTEAEAWWMVEQLLAGFPEDRGPATAAASPASVRAGR